MIVTLALLIPDSLSLNYNHNHDYI